MPSDNPDHMTPEQAAKFWFDQWQQAKITEFAGWQEARELAKALRDAPLLPGADWAEVGRARALTQYETAVKMGIYKVENHGVF